MKLILPLAFVSAGILLGQQQPPPGPPPVSCGVHGDVEILCGTRSPEDLELTPDGNYLIVSQFVNGRGGTGAGLVLFNLAKKTYGKIPITSEPNKDWGDPMCPGPIGEALVPHGISLAKKIKGATRLYVVNHGGGRQSIEMYEVKPAGGSWSLVWHGCVPAMKEFNDVAITSDGGFIATHPTALMPATGGNVISGQPSGFVVRWTPGRPEAELPNTRQGYPNGVLVSPNGRYMYYNAWTNLSVHKYDLKKGTDAGVVKLDFMPDNITWTPEGRILAAGVKGVRGNCPATSSEPCIQGFGIAELDPAKWTAKTVFDSAGKGNIIAGVSVALQVGGSIYVGAFQGDRLVRIH